MAKQNQSFLKVGTEWIELEIISESDVILTTFGYAPFLQVKEITTDIEYRLYISAKSLAEPLEELRKHNGDVFKGIQFGVRKESLDKKAKFAVNVSIDPDEGFQESLNSSEDLKKKLANALFN